MKFGSLGMPQKSYFFKALFEKNSIFGENLSPEDNVKDKI